MLGTSICPEEGNVTSMRDMTDISESLRHAPKGVALPIQDWVHYEAPGVARYRWGPSPTRCSISALSYPRIRYPLHLTLPQSYSLGTRPSATPATGRPEVKELQEGFAMRMREKTALMRTVEASRHEIQLRSMKGPREVGVGQRSML